MAHHAETESRVPWTNVRFFRLPIGKRPGPVPGAVQSVARLLDELRVKGRVVEGARLPGLAAQEVLREVAVQDPAWTTPGKMRRRSERSRVLQVMTTHQVAY